MIETVKAVYQSIDADNEIRIIVGYRVRVLSGPMMKEQVFLGPVLADMCQAKLGQKYPCEKEYA
jgi:hypothetical protein|tara:strand:+ start:1147 stop:1338 length:192 start_codon:yes stop_codon:yes gene_type:complete